MKTFFKLYKQGCHIRNVIGVLLLLGCSINLGAQAAFVKGYYINENSDTIRGEVKFNPKKEQEAFNKFNFKDINGGLKIYKPDKIKAYGFNEKHFVAMDSDGEMKYFEVLAAGNISLYKLMFETLRMNKSVYESEYYLKKSEQPKLIVVKEGKFKKQISEWMKDKTDLIEKFNDDKKFEPNSAIELINQYNSWKKTNTD
jgi:hypothetical protein